jgi:hypothetical protein
VASVAKTPNADACTARVHLKEPRLPDPERWAKQFKAKVGNVYEFRGIEVTVKGTVREQDGQFVLTAPGLQGPVPLAKLRTKVQWNAKKRLARPPDADERDAYDHLTARGKGAGADGFPVQVTGPLRMTEKGPVLEVREFEPVGPGARLPSGVRAAEACAWASARPEPAKPSAVSSIRNPNTTPGSQPC